MFTMSPLAKSILPVLFVVVALQLSPLTGSQATTTCPPNTYGVNCAVYCKEHDDSTNGHYTCDSQGNKICRQGFKGPATDCKNPNSTLRNRQPCQNGGTCVNGTVSSFACLCAPLYAGRRCSTHLSPSTSQQLTTLPTKATAANGQSWAGHAANTSQLSATQPPQNSRATKGPDSPDTALIVGLSVGVGGLLLLILLVIIIMLYKHGYCDKGKNKIIPLEQ